MRWVISNLHFELTHNCSIKPVKSTPLGVSELKGVFNKNYLIPKYNTIWSVEKVLDYMQLL